MKKGNKCLMLMSITLLFILIVGAWQGNNKYSAKESIAAMNVIEDNTTFVTVRNKTELSDRIIQIFKEPIRIGEQYYSIPDVYVTKLQTYLTNNANNITKKELYAFFNKFQEGKNFLEKLEGNNINLSSEDKAVLYFITKNGLEQIHLNIAYDPISGGIKVNDLSGNTIYSTNTIQDNFDLDYSFLLKVIIAFAIGYLLYFIRRLWVKKEVYNTNTRVYE